MNFNHEIGKKFIQSLQKSMIIKKSLIETKIFNDDWIDYIKENLQYINNIIRNPRTYIKENKNVVPVEMARKTTAESVRHLATHSHYIRDINEKGEVLPKKILATSQGIEKATYENRFIKTLIDKLNIFLERRFETIKKLNESDLLHQLNTSTNLNYENLDIEFALKLNIYQKIHFEQSENENKLLLNKICDLLKFVRGFINSSFYQALKDADNVSSPINKTNIINKDNNYHKCYLLWVYLDKNYRLDYEISRFESEYEIDKNELMKIFIQSFFSFYHKNIDYDQFKKSIDTHKNKKSNKTLVLSSSPTVSKLDMENYLINEYYYQQSRKVYTRRIQERVDNGEPFYVAFEDVYRGAFKITEQIFEDLMRVPDDIKKNPKALLKFKIRNQNALEEIYKLKIKDLVKVQKAQLQLIKEIENSKLQIEKMKLQEKTNKKPVLTKTELALEKQKLINTIEVAKSKLQAQREKAIAKFNEAKVIEKQKAKIKIKNEKEKAREKIKLEREKAKALLEIKRKTEIAKYEAKIAEENIKLNEKIKNMKLEIWEKAEAQILEIRRQASKQIEQIKKKTIEEMEKIENNLQQTIKGDK